jgi:glycosyltransferase involved in cell wall biosynthesis
MKICFFANRMPDMCGAFLHDIDLATELQKRGHSIVFLIIKKPAEGYNGDVYRGFRFLHYTAALTYLESSHIWICPHSPILPDVRKINSRGYYRPIMATCHFDGNYRAIVVNVDNRWSESLLFVNKVMQENYYANIKPFPPSIVHTDTVRPIMHRDQILITEPFKGEYLTLVNANLNKGVVQFIELARRMPERKFLGVLPYYGELQVPPAPSNVEWIRFDDDIRNILKMTHILLMPSYSESFGRIAVEAMINGIPVIYSKPALNAKLPKCSTEGVEEWIGDAALACDREAPQEWMDAIVSLDDSDTYAALSAKSREHIDKINLFTEASRIAGIVENFAREHPAVVRSSIPAPEAATSGTTGGRTGQPRLQEPVGPVGFSSGRLKIRR